MIRLALALALSLAQAVLPLIGRAFALSDTLVSGAFGIYGLTQGLLQLPFGMASDRLGRKRVILIGLGGFVASMAAFGLAATSGLEGWLAAGVAFLLMAVVFAIYGLFGSAAPIASQAYVADRTSRAARTRRRASTARASSSSSSTDVSQSMQPSVMLWP